MAHVIVLSIFIFTIPILHVSFKPSFVFLGPILKMQDVGDISQEGGGAQGPLLFSPDSVGSEMENFFSLSENVGRRFIQGPSRQPASPGSVGTQEKIVRKTLFEIPAEVKQEQTEPVAAPIEADHEIAPYNPLGLFSR